MPQPRIEGWNPYPKHGGTLDAMTSGLIPADVVAHVLKIAPGTVRSKVRRGQLLPVASDVRTRAHLFDVATVLAVRK